MTDTSGLSERQAFMLGELREMFEPMLVLPNGSRRIRTARVLESRGLVTVTPRGTGKGFTVRLREQHELDAAPASNCIKLPPMDTNRGLSLDDLVTDTEMEKGDPIRTVSDERPELDEILEYVRGHHDANGNLILDLSIHIAQKKIDAAIERRHGSPQKGD